MARRAKNEGWFELLFWLFTRYSVWLCIPIALAAFIGIEIATLVVASISPVTRGLTQSAPMFGSVAALVVLLAGLKAGIEKGARRKIYDCQTSIESIRALSWFQFELLIGEAYRRQGYEVVETGAGADGGIDLKLKGHLETVIVQCKQWKAYKVGVKPIRELYGVLIAERADRAVFVTSGVYTQEARGFAKEKPMELIDGDTLCRLVTTIPQSQADRKRLDVRITQVSPACPKCRSSMALRRSKRGGNAGSEFWGCSTYPKCTGTRPFEGPPE